MADMRRERRGGNTFYRVEGKSPAYGSSLWEDCPMLAIVQDPSLAFVHFNDFETYSTGEAGYETDSNNSGTVTATNAVAGANGVITITASDGTAGADDETYVQTEDYPIILASGYPLWIETRVKFTEVNTDDANIMFGLTNDTDLEDTMADDGTMAADYEGVTIHKIQDATVWVCEDSNSTTQTTSITTATRVSGSWTRLGMRIDYPQTEYFVDGAIVATHNTLASVPVVAMGWCWGVKNLTTNGESLLVDWVKVVQLR